MINSCFNEGQIGQFAKKKWGNTKKVLLPFISEHRVLDIRFET
jgi:hypothetical protein